MRFFNLGSVRDGRRLRCRYLPVLALSLYARNNHSWPPIRRPRDTNPAASGLRRSRSCTAPSFSPSPTRPVSYLRLSSTPGPYLRRYLSLPSSLLATGVPSHKNHTISPYALHLSDASPSANSSAPLSSRRYDK